MNWMKRMSQTDNSVDFEIVSDVDYNESDDQYFYHVTTTTRLSDILSSGLHPNKESTVKGWYEGYSKGKVFFCERSKVAWWKDRIEEHLFHNFDDPPDVVIIRFLKTLVQSPLSDEVGTEDSRAPSYYSTDPIKRISKEEL